MFVLFKCSETARERRIKLSFDWNLDISKLKLEYLVQQQISDCIICHRRPSSERHWRFWSFGLSLKGGEGGGVGWKILGIKEIANGGSQKMQGVM